MSFPTASTLHRAQIRRVQPIPDAIHIPHAQPGLGPRQPLPLLVTRRAICPAVDGTSETEQPCSAGSLRSACLPVCPVSPSQTWSECCRTSPAGMDGNHAELQLLPVSPAQAKAGAIEQHHLIFTTFIQFETAYPIEPNDS